MSDSSTLRDIFQADQREAAHQGRVQSAKRDADVVAAYYKRMKERGVPPPHALALTESWQAMNCGVDVEWEE